MTSETDIYGMTPEERKAFEAGFSEPVRPGDASKDGRYLCRDTHIEALSWAACAKLHMKKAFETAYIYVAAVRHRDEIIAQLEAEVKDLRRQLEDAHAELSARGEDAQ